MRITKWQGDYSGADGHINASKLGLICCMPTLGLPWWLRGKQSACQCRRLRFDSWVGKILCKRKEMATHSRSLCLRNPTSDMKSSVHEVRKESDIQYVVFTSIKVMFEDICNTP